MLDNLLNRLSRVTSRGNYIGEIDGLRFFAIAVVVLLHIAVHLRRLFPEKFSGSEIDTALAWLFFRGGLGVDVFFAISGFILALPFINELVHEGRKVILKDYYIRRVTRLEPPYIISLILLFGLQVAAGRLSFGEHLPNFFASFFYIHNIVYDAWSVINPVAWSLEIEVQFYLLAPFLFRWLFSIKSPTTRRGTIVFIVLSLIAVNFIFKDLIEDLHLRKSIIVELHLFLIGVLFADLYLSKRESFSGRTYWNDLLGIVWIALVYALKDTRNYVLESIYAFSILLIFLGAFKGRGLNRFFTLKPVTVIGGMCYSLYLWHYAIIAVLMTYTSYFFWSNSFVLNFGIQALLLIPPVLICSAMYFYWIEKPCMRPNWFHELKSRLIRT
jgi:peptidoglycan/LPS O-acetylase OafA/YrhL